MKHYFSISLVVLALMLAGCASKKSKISAAAKPAPVAVSQSIVTPDNSLMAKVVSVNTVGRFVVLNFPSGPMPKLDQTLFLYRAGLKSAEVKITGPQTENNIVADLVSGDAQAGDIVRE